MSQSSIAFRTVLLTSMKFWVLLLAAFAISSASPLDSDEGFLCGVCQIMVGTAENLLIGGHTEDEIIADMDKVKLTSDSTLIRRSFSIIFGFFSSALTIWTHLYQTLDLAKLARSSWTNICTPPSTSCYKTSLLRKFAKI